MTGILQTDLFENSSGMKDPTSAENRRHPVHRWVPWVAGFSASFVDDVIARFLPSDGMRTPVVLDPFCGVGTTLVECQRRGVDSIGFEINPYAALASRVKTTVLHVNLELLDEAVGEYARSMAEPGASAAGNCALLTSTASPVYPSGFKTRIPFYSDQVLEQVLATLQFVSSLSDAGIRDLFLLAFGSVSVKFSNYSYEPSLATRPGSGKPLILNARVAETVGAKLREMRDDIAAVQREFAWRIMSPTASIWQDSFFRASKYLEKSCVDLVVTSPPYLNNYHYVRNTRPQLWWLGLIKTSNELRSIEDDNVGKFWQTVRDREAIPLTVSVAEAQAMVEEIRGRNCERGAYGGPGWANYVASYFNDLNEFARVASDVLRPGGRAVVVVGNSIIQGVEIKVDEILSRIADLHGLGTEAIDVIRAKRVGSSIVGSTVRREGERQGVPLYDSAVILSKERAQA